MYDLTMMVPSRGRPENIVRLRNSWISTATGNSRLLVLVDDDDPSLSDYFNISGIDIQVGPRLRIGGTLNVVAPSIAPSTFAIGFMGDDHVPLSIGWDQEFVHVLKNFKTGVVYGNDLFHGENLPTAVAMTSNIVETLGYFVMPGGIHLFLDNFWLAIGRGLNRIAYLPEVIIEHIHPAYGKGDWDKTYNEANSSSVWSTDEATFNNYVATTLESDLEKLRALP